MSDLDVAMPDDPYDALPPAEEVPRVRTSLTASDLRSALILGHHETTGADIPPARLRAAWCMLCVEHAGHDATGKLVEGWAVWDFDLGNIGRGAWLGDVFDLTAAEDLPSGRHLVTQQLRAHSSATAGAADYWAFLLAGYPEAIAAMDRGDLDGPDRGDAQPCGLAAELKRRRYYTAPEREYAHGLVTWAREYDRRWPA